MAKERPKFRATTTANNINEEAQIHAKVDGKKRKQKPKKTRRKDTELPQTSVPKEVVAYEAVYGEMHDSVERAATTNIGLDVEQDKDSGPRRQETMGDAAAYTRSERVSKFPNDPPLLRVNILGSREDRLQLKELMELCIKLSDMVLDLEKTKTAQAKEIANLKKRVKRLERKKKSRSHGLKRLYKVGLSARVESSAEEESLSKEIQTREDRRHRFSTAAPITTSITDDELTMAQALVEIKKSKPKGATTTTTTTITIPTPDSTRPKARGEEEQGEMTIEEKSRLFKELMDKRKKHFAILSAEEQRRKPLTKAQKRNQICVYLKNMAGFTHNQLKNKIFDEVQKAFDKTMSDKLDQERSKKKKVEDDKKQEELKRCLEIILDDEDDVTIDATPLSIKTLIIDYKIYKEGKKVTSKFSEQMEIHRFFLLIPQPIHTTPPNDDYVTPATKSILDELLEEFSAEILNVTMVDEEADFNPTKDIEELERLLAKDPLSHFTKIQVHSVITKPEPFIHTQPMSPLYEILESYDSSTEPYKVYKEMKSPSKYGLNSSFPYLIANVYPNGVYCYFHPHLIPSEGMDTLLPKFFLLIPQPIHTTPPNDDYVTPATKSILDELLEEFSAEILNVTMVDEEADFNPTKDIEELERLLAKDPLSHFTKIQPYRWMLLEEGDLEHGLDHVVSSSCRANPRE
nr:hypothetical protein [Tanacetum cinerariifolium]